jgi:hypothetical protein
MDIMKKIDLAQAIGILANVGVVAGIVFLAVEIRQNNELMQSEASIAYVEMRRGGLRSQAQDNEFLGSILKAGAGEALSPLDSLKLDLWYYSIFVNWEWEYEQYQAGTLNVLNQPPELRWRPTVDFYPLMRESWSTRRQQLSAEFVQYMEERVLN